MPKRSIILLIALLFLIIVCNGSVSRGQFSGEISQEDLSSFVNQKDSVPSGSGQDYEEINELKQASENNPQDTLNWLNLKLLYCQMGKYDDALSVMDQAIEKNPNTDWALQIKGDVLVDLGKYDEAMELYNQAMDIDQNNINNVASKGNLLEILGKNDNAMELYDDFANRNPKDEQIYAIKGDLLWKMGKVDEAIEAYKRAIKNNPNYTYALDKLKELKNKGYDVDVPDEIPITPAPVVTTPVTQVPVTPKPVITSPITQVPVTPAPGLSQCCQAVCSGVATDVCSYDEANACAHACGRLP